MEAPLPHTHTGLTIYPISQRLPLPGEPTRDLVFGRSDRGRPVIPGIPAGRLDFNVSHHGPLVVLAAVAPECGADDGDHPTGKDRKTLAFLVVRESAKKKQGVFVRHKQRLRVLR